MAAMQAPWPEAVTIDTGGAGPGAGQPGPPGSADADADAVQRAIKAIRPPGPQHAWRPVRPVMVPD
jgi:hypothetical protein